MNDFDSSLNEARKNQDHVKNIVKMNKFMNEKYNYLKSMWLDLDVVSMRFGVGLAIYLFLFH